MDPDHSSSSPGGSEPDSRGSSRLPVPFSVTFGDANVVTFGEGEMIPQPLEGLQGTQIPPFLSKTFDLVDDPVLDPIISWGSSGQSFVVWDAVEFGRIILPRNFKHSNFSSFVRQLNTYGFRKIDPDKWEFANESFLRGHKHLLKNIQRRKPNPSMSTSNNNEEFNKLLIEAEIERLQKEKMEMMQQVINLQNKNYETNQHMESINEKLEAAELKQKQMVAFLAKAVQNRSFVSSSLEGNEQMPRNYEQHPLSFGGSSRNIEFGAQNDKGVSKGKNVLKTKPEGAPDHSLEPLADVKQDGFWGDLGDYELPELWTLGISTGENRQGDDSFRKTDP